MHRPLKFQHGNHIYSQYMTNTIFFTDDGLFLKFNITNYNCKIWAQYCTKLSELHKEPYGLNGIILHSCPYELANIYGYFGASLCFSSPEKLNFKSFSSLCLWGLGFFHPPITWSAYKKVVILLTEVLAPWDLISVLWWTKPPEIDALGRWGLEKRPYA